MNLQNSQFLSALQVQDQLQNQTKKPLPLKQTNPGISFQEILARQTKSADEVKFSKHAVNRLNDRGISLSENQINRLNEGTVKASAKGIKESLVIVDQMAFIVNIPNNTVVTAMNQREASENVFTNIDGAVII
ncbi:MAG: flagellar protein [Lachnospiraceae bacterium]|nr:flagellar protein [Lachnospiraceae bacterium]